MGWEVVYGPPVRWITFVHDHLTLLFDTAPSIAKCIASPSYVHGVNDGSSEAARNRMSTFPDMDLEAYSSDPCPADMLVNRKSYGFTGTFTRRKTR